MLLNKLQSVELPSNHLLSIRETPKETLSRLCKEPLLSNSDSGASCFNRSARSGEYNWEKNDTSVAGVSQYKYSQSQKCVDPETTMDSGIKARGCVRSYKTPSCAKSFRLFSGLEVG